MTQLLLPRRKFLQGLGLLLAAPAIVRAESLMPVRALEEEELPRLLYLPLQHGFVKQDIFWLSNPGVDSWVRQLYLVTEVDREKVYYKRIDDLGA